MLDHLRHDEPSTTSAKTQTVNATTSISNIRSSSLAARTSLNAKIVEVPLRSDLVI